MNLSLRINLGEEYKSSSQRARVITEHWVSEQVYCPNCGHLNIDKYGNNQPVADFFCSNCREDYELKSNKAMAVTKIVNGAYRTMIERLLSSNNPNFFILNYNLQNYEVSNFLVIPKHFMIPEMIEKRKALSLTARRAGWIGCNILLRSIPQTGKIFFIRNQKIEPKEKVLSLWKKTLFLRDVKEVTARGWTLDVMRCIENLKRADFSLEDLYGFENELRSKHPDNKYIRDKIRQQLQILRDKGYIEFINRGNYRLT